MNPIVLVLVTFVVYSLIPLIIAYSTKEPIQAKKYQNYCFGGNLVVFVIFVIINSSNSGGAAAYNAGYLIGYNAAPYALWTAVGCAIGSSALKKKGLYIKKGETAPTNGTNNNNTVSFTGNAQQYTAPQQPASAAKPQYNNYNSQQQYNSNSQQQYSAPQQPASTAKPQYDNYKPQQYSSNSQQHSAPQSQQQYNGGYAQQQYSARPQSAAPKFCSQCGSQLAPGSRFCSNCGADTSANR